MPNTPRIQPNARQVEILAFPGVQILDLAGPLQVFSTANALAGKASLLYQTRIVATGAETVTASAGLPLVATACGPPDVPLDTLLIPGGPGVESAAADAQLVDWIRARTAAARRTAAVCTGAFLLAETGLLDGRRVVTHWKFCNALADRFPKIAIEPDRIFIGDGPFWTSAGITAGIDLALSFVEADCGRALALAVARHLVVFLKRPGGQSQFSAALAFQSAAYAFEPLHAWMADHLGETLSVSDLAQQAGMSERSFARHYRAKVGLTPAQGLERLRIDTARRLLTDTGGSIKGIARRCGFGSEETMRRAFRRCLAVNPQDYRARFSG